MGERPCRDCATPFPTTGNAHTYCPPCRTERRKVSHKLAMRVWRDKNRSRARAVKSRWDLKQYGLTPEQYETMQADQAGVCAICHRMPDGGRGVTRRLVVDHCHVSGSVRGLLCPNCNTAIGLLREDQSSIAAAAEYLRRHEEPACV